MATVINNPGNNNGESTGMGMIIGIIVAIIVIALLLIYGIPAIRNNGTNNPPSGTTNINLNATLPTPGTNSSGTNNGY